MKKIAHRTNSNKKGFSMNSKSLLMYGIFSLAFIENFSQSVCFAADEVTIDAVEADFRALPNSVRRLTGPLLWLHGDETKQRLELEISKVAEGGNGSFTAEGRPAADWLGEGWWRDLTICRDAAKKHDLSMWIFDEEFFPSGEVAGEVPRIYGSKVLYGEAQNVQGPAKYTKSGFYVPQVSSFQQRYKGNLVAVIAGNDTGDGIDGNSLVDLTPMVKNGSLAWDAPVGNWKVMTFTWGYYVDDQRWAKNYGNLWDQMSPLVDGASKDAVAWYLRTVYQPHYEHFREDFGKTISGFFFDEPDVPSDWGTEVSKVLTERGVDWKKALVAYKFKLAGEEQVAAKYHYLDAFAEAWGRTMYGGITEWCHKHKVESIGHWIEHNWCYLDPWFCAGNMFQLLKYSDMGAIDMVASQIIPGKRDMSMDLMPKLASSISHVYGKRDDRAMCEMFGAYGQGLTYPDMKWQTDLMQVWGVNFLIPHSFNPRAPRDLDCPPFFYNGGEEPRWPLYRVFADYTSRLSVLLTGGYHVCPVAFLFVGNSHNVGTATPPEQMTRTMQEALFDCDWIPYDVFEQNTKLREKTIQLYGEGYKILVVPPVEVIPYDTLAKAKQFFDQGGVVIGYGFVPSKSATLGRSSSEITGLCDAIWGSAGPSLAVHKTNAHGGRSYFLPEKPSSEDIQQVLTADADIHPTLEVLKGKTRNWLYVLHRVKAGRDVFFVCNQDLHRETKQFRFRLTADGVPECWDAMRNEITAVPYQRVGEKTVEVSLSLEPSESILLVFQPKNRKLPMRPDRLSAKSAGRSIEVVRDPPADSKTTLATGEKDKHVLALNGCSWVWYPEGKESVDSAQIDFAPGTRYFRHPLNLPSEARINSARFLITTDNAFVLYVNSCKAGQGDNWNTVVDVNLTDLLQPGSNQLAIAATNTGSGPAGLIGMYLIQLDNGQELSGRIDGSWKTANQLFDGWTSLDFDDRVWLPARPFAKLGEQPWNIPAGAIPSPAGMTLSPVQADIFEGHFTVPDQISLAGAQVYLEMDELIPEEAAQVTLNGREVGGFIGKPFRLEVGRYVQPGSNRLKITPFAPKSVRLFIE
jgi:hypothetical protein